VQGLQVELQITSLISSENCCAVETAIFDASLGGYLHKIKSRQTLQIRSCKGKKT
jgi:hypothetical protein